MWCASRVNSWPLAFFKIRQWYETSCVIKSFIIRWSKLKQNRKNDFSNLCKWLLHNELSIHFEEDKTKSILFGTKRKLRKASKLNIVYHVIDIKQNFQVTYHGCILVETMSGEPVAYKTITKFISWLSFLFRKNIFWPQDSDGSYATYRFSCILITRTLRGILILPKNWKIKFKLLIINVFDFASILIKWLMYQKISLKN